jgi:hypothetical protein
MSTLRMKYLWTPYMCILAGFGIADYRGWRCVLAKLRSNQEVVVQIARHLTSIAILALLLAIVSYSLCNEPHHNKTNIMRLRPAWIQTSLRYRAVRSESMLFAITFSTCNRVCKRTPWILIRLHGCWSQTHYVGFVMTRLIYCCIFYLISCTTCMS